MRLPGRIAAAIEVLEAMAQTHRPASEALRDWGQTHRFAGSGDRAAIGNLVYDALRNKASHAYAMGGDSARNLVLSVAVRDWGENAEALSAGFAEDRHGPEPLTSDELTRLTAPDPLTDAPDHVRADIPEWIVPSFTRVFGDRLVAEGQTMTGRPPLDLRVNSLKSDREKVLKALKRVSPLPTAIAPHGLRIAAGQRDARTPNVQADEAYLKGRFEVQDEGSQIVAMLCGVQTGEQVLDLCAGAGGKTLAMAAAMDNKGQIFAYDADRSRLAPIYDRLKRNGARNVQVRAPEDGALDDLIGKMDAVVVDAPCTGTGTWRRRPDTKWKLTPDQLALRTSEQDAVLEEAAKYVRPGGRLVYITCSMLPEENDDRVSAFLAKTPEYACRSPQQVWSDVFTDTTPTPIFTDHGVLLTPATTGTDGFFCAVLDCS